MRNLLRFVACVSSYVIFVFSASDVTTQQQKPQPPCYNPLNPSFETICYSTILSSGNVSVRNIGSGVLGELVDGFSATSSFPGGSEIGAAEVFSYFGGYNDQFTKLAVTAPLIFRPAPTGTWIASLALATSAFPDPTTAPRFVSGSDMLFEAFGNRTIAAYLFNTIQLAMESDYVTACNSLTSVLPALGYTPVPTSPWAEAWVTWSTEAIVGDRVNECWIEVVSTKE